MLFRSVVVYPLSQASQTDPGGSAGGGAAGDERLPLHLDFLDLNFDETLFFYLGNLNRVAFCSVVMLPPNQKDCRDVIMYLF